MPEALVDDPTTAPVPFDDEVLQRYVRGRALASVAGNLMPAPLLLLPFTLLVALLMASYVGLRRYFSEDARLAWLGLFAAFMYVDVYRYLTWRLLSEHLFVGALERSPTAVAVQRGPAESQRPACSAHPSSPT